MKPELGGIIGALLISMLLSGCPGSSSGQTGYPGAPCDTDADCLFDGRCWVLADGFPGGYCTIEGCQTGSCPEGSQCFELTDNVKRCIDSCTDNSECRTEQGYVCDADNTCWPDPGSVKPGGRCEYNQDCIGGINAICIKQAGFLDGYCMIDKCSPACPSGSDCRPVLDGGSSACVPTCASELDCRAGYVCNQEPGSEWDGVCIPGCTTGSCPEPFSCVETDLWSGHICKDISYLCSPKNTHGDCPAGQVCSDTGECVPFACDDIVLEPNQDSGQAQPLPTQDSAGMQICEGDEDWFSFTPVQPNTLYQLGIDYNLSSGDLEIQLLDDQENLVDEAHLDLGDINELFRPGPVNNESLSLVAVPGGPVHYLRVFGSSNAVNNYTLLSKSLDFRDGSSCTDLYSLEDCRARAADGSDDFARLIPFPSPQPMDPVIGDGVFFESGLSMSDQSVHESSSIRWARRELIMLLRYAIFEVQEAFPGTTPLAIGDIGLSDGSTPWGHPDHTHDGGCNVDIAYYIKAEFQRQWGNLVYRQICCDYDHLIGYSCVDDDESSDGYGMCVPGSENTHIVDIPRTALLLAKLATGNRLRAAGVEAKIVPELKAEFLQLLNDGAITQQEYDTVVAKTFSAADDPSWIWHFHHMHISLCKGDCAERSLRSLVMGPWAGLSREQQRPYLHYWLTGDRSHLGSP